MQREHELLSRHRALGPNVVSGKNAKFLHRKPFEDAFNVLRVNVLALLGYDHVFLAPAQLQVTVLVEISEVAGHQPTIHNRLGGEFRIIEIRSEERRVGKECRSRWLSVNE